MITFILIIIGFILLIKGSQLLIDASELIAKKLKISELVIGLTLVSIGTSLPELLISIEASLIGNSDIVLGNVIGSNITNLLLILGITAIIKPIKFKRVTKIFEIPFMLFVAASFYLLANVNNEISLIDSLVLLSLLAGFMYQTFKIPTNKEDYQEVKIKKIHITIINLILGIILLFFGSRLVVNNTIELATILNVENSIISLTLVALGTSLPEIVTYLVATFKGTNEMALGNIIGSNIMNVLLIVGISGIINPITYSANFNTQFLILFVASTLLLVFAYTGKKNTMTKYNGLLYCIIYVIYLFVTIP